MRIVQVCFAALLALAPPVASASSSVIPKQFRGEWNESLAQCGTDQGDSYLYLAARRVSYWESFGPVRAAVARGNELALILELSEEGESWLTTAQFQLSPDGTTLTSSPGSEDAFVRYRCPPKGARPNNSSKPTPLRGAA